MEKILKKVLKQRKKILKELNSELIKKCKNEIKFYKFIKTMEYNGQIYLPPFISLDTLIDICRQEIEGLRKNDEQFKQL